MKSITTIDLNCDMGESFGAWKMGSDSLMFDYVSSANIACGFHAGDPGTIRETVLLAQNKGVSIGAHPGFPDLQGFGRRDMSLSEKEIFDLVLYQVSALKGICEAYGATLRHVKPHGALYNLSARDVRIATAIAAAVKQISNDLVLYGLSGSHSIAEARRVGLQTASEVFADRTYQDDASLTPRSMPNSLITNSTAACGQTLQMVEQGKVTTISGNAVSIEAETICIHGDGENAVEFASEIKKCLEDRGILVKRL